MNECLTWGLVDDLIDKVQMDNLIEIGESSQEPEDEEQGPRGGEPEGGVLLSFGEALERRNRRVTGQSPPSVTVTGQSPDEFRVSPAELKEGLGAAVEPLVRSLRGVTDGLSSGFDRLAESQGLLAEGLAEQARALRSMEERIQGEGGQSPWWRRHPAAAVALGGAVVVTGLLIWRRLLSDGERARRAESLAHRASGERDSFQMALGREQRRPLTTNQTHRHHYDQRKVVNDQRVSHSHWHRHTPERTVERILEVPASERVVEVHHEPVIIEGAYTGRRDARGGITWQDQKDARTIEQLYQEGART